MAAEDPITPDSYLQTPGSLGGGGQSHILSGPQEVTWNEGEKQKYPHSLGC